MSFDPARMIADKGNIRLEIENAFISAKWDYIIEDGWEHQGIRVIGSYFSSTLLRFVIGGVPQGSVLGLVLWIILYDGLLKINLPG